MKNSLPNSAYNLIFQGRDISVKGEIVLSGMFFDFFYKTKCKISKSLIIYEKMQTLKAFAFEQMPNGEQFRKRK